ncbi:hypothetical protein EDC65_4336 [Stella humosa]|uniref:Uncharacterized protein n=1 Tax=Stella humosa TaxID=94 RepID=A0A3N1KWU6_9PROT|nr:hypothetical protein [Stella humosa]ROP83687.1 hypothetical protein EDC65_4336 [Stella humosa]BBK33041.1 hypothetical protein STHU_36750 [Stella humosa]
MKAALAALLGIAAVLPASAGSNEALMEERRRAAFSLNEKILERLRLAPEGSQVILSVRVGPGVGADRDFRVDDLVVMDGRTGAERSDALRRLGLGDDGVDRGPVPVPAPPIR